MTTKEKILSTGLALARDAGSALADAGAAASSAVGSSLVKAVPTAKQLGTKVKELVSVGAALAIAKKGGKAALAAAKKNPVAVAAGTVALAGLGVAVVVARKRKQAREDAAAAAAKPTRVVARNMRGDAATVAKKAPAKKAPAKKAASRARKPAGTSTH
jgi:DNA-binding protein HU-beta